MEPLSTDLQKETTKSVYPQDAIHRRKATAHRSGLVVHSNITFTLKQL